MIGQSVQCKYRTDMLKVKVTARFHILIVSSDDIFWAAEPFVINHHTSECAKKEWVAFFTVKVTARAPVIKTWLLLVLIWKVHNHMPDCLVKRLLFLRSRSQQKVQIFIECLSFCSDNLVMPHELQCHEKRLFCCVQDQDHSIGWLINNLIILIVFSELLNLLRPNSVWSILWNN